MRKINSGIIVFIFALALLVCFPQSVKAEEDLVIPQWEVDAQILETGDLSIIEDITFRFNDEFSGVFREIVLNKTSGLSDINVMELKDSGLKQYSQVEDAKEGDSDVFLIEEKKDKITIQIFSPSEDQEKTFRISYEVKNVAIKYNDTGEIYYKFLGDENETPIESFTVNIKLPRNDSDNQVKVFAHGPLNGKINKENDATYSLHVTDVPSDTFVEGRILFPKEFIPLSENTENIDNYSNILEEEAAYQNELIKKRERKAAIQSILEKASILASILGFAVFVIFLILFRREKDFYKVDEYTGIPEECTPAVASYLTGDIINTNTIFATILDLIRKGYIKINGKEEKDIKPDEQEFVITQVKKEDNLLLSHEKRFINWLFNKMGDGQSVSTEEIKSFSKKNSSKFIEMYADWKNKVKEDAVLKGYYDKSKIKYGVVILIYSIVLFTLGIFTLVYGSLFGLASLGLSIVLFIYSITMFYRRSDYGYQQYRKWIAFRKYMKKYKKGLSEGDFIQHSSDISLIYALSLGIKNEVDGNYVYSNGSWAFWYLMFVNNKNNAFEKSMNESFGGTTGSYSGGGFSGGGGGGAGGGGAGGF